MYMSAMMLIAYHLAKCGVEGMWYGVSLIDMTTSISDIRLGRLGVVDVRRRDVELLRCCWSSVSRLH